MTSDYFAFNVSFLIIRFIKHTKFFKILLGKVAGYNNGIHREIVGPV